MTRENKTYCRRENISRPLTKQIVFSLICNLWPVYVFYIKTLNNCPYFCLNLKKKSCFRIHLNNK